MKTKVILLKRLLSCLLLSIISLAPLPFPAHGEDAELLSAVSVGLIHNADLVNLDQPVDTIDFYQVLLKSIELNTQPAQATADRLASLEPGNILRGDAATLVYSAVLESYFHLDTSEGVYPYDCFEYVRTTDTFSNRCGDAMPCQEFVLFNSGKIGMDVWSVGYCAMQYDPYSMQTLFDVDDAGFFRIEDSLTRAEAFKAAYRLYRSNHQSELLTLDQVEPMPLSPEQLALAAKMPPAEYNHLPDWKGTALDNKTFINQAHHTGSMYTRDDFEILGDLGFNFTRVFMTHQLLFDLREGVSIRKDELLNIDEAIGYAIDQGVHICICLYDFPGFAGASMDDAGFYDKAMLENVTTAYSILAKRYQNVPNSVLSFNLFNEPWKITKKQEKAYVKAVRAVSKGIWQYGDRLIFVDGLAGSQLPVQSLAKEPYAQAFHMYEPDPFIYTGWVGGITWYAGQQWPLPYVQGILENKSKLTVQGGFDAGTQVEVLMVGNQRAGKLNLLADGVTIASLSLTAKQTQQGETFALATLPSDAAKIEFQWLGKGIAQIRSIALIYPQEDAQGTPKYSSPWASQSTSELVHSKMTVIYCDYGNFQGDQKQSTLTIHPDGSYENEKQADLAFDQGYLKARLDPWIQFRDKTGVGVMIQEWGTLDNIAKKASLSYIRDWVDLLAEANVPWNLWSDYWQYLDTGRLDVTYEDYRGHRLDRDMVDALIKR